VYDKHRFALPEEDLSIVCSLEENLKESFSFPTVDKSDLKVSTLITDPQYEQALFSVFSTELPQLKHFIINPLSLLH
jgi:hypothetical protein